MFETVVTLKPHDQWRPGMTWDKLVAEMNAKLKTPGMANIFWMPIQTRTEMLTTGFRSVLGVKVFGPDLAGIQERRHPDREGADRPAGHPQRLRRADDRRLFPGFHRQPRGGRALRADGRRRERRHRDGHRRQHHRHHRRGPRALSRSACATPATTAATSMPLKRVLVPDAHRAPRCRSANWPTSAYRTGPPSIRDENGQLVGFVFVDVTTANIDGYVQAGQRAPRRARPVPAGLLFPMGGPVRVSARTPSSAWRS